MKLKLYHVLVSLAVLLPIVGAACESVIPALQQGVDTAKQISDGAAKVEAEVQKEIDALPPGDVVRVALEKKLVQVKAVHADADKYVGTAQASINALKTGDISPELAGVLGTLPYGQYVVGLGGIVLMLIHRYKTGGLATDLANLTTAYKTVGPELSADDKAKAAAILGPELAAKVHDPVPVPTILPAV